MVGILEWYGTWWAMSALACIHWKHNRQCLAKHKVMKTDGCTLKIHFPGGVDDRRRNSCWSRQTRLITTQFAQLNCDVQSEYLHSARECYYQLVCLSRGCKSGGSLLGPTFRPHPDLEKPSRAHHILCWRHQAETTAIEGSREKSVIQCMQWADFLVCEAQKDKH